MNPLIQLKKAALAFLVPLVCFGILPKAQAVSPAPDGGYPGGNTAEGQAALLSLTTGGFNTAVGYLSLRSDTTGQLNTAIGAATLLANTGDQNTATGAGALLSNTVAYHNTADGAFALFGNTTGIDNTAIGDQALFSNTTANANTADGAFALFNNTTGGGNTAIGGGAGFNQTTGINNVYIGFGINGVAGENYTCYIASILGQTIPVGSQVLVDSNNKLGTPTSSKRFKQNIKPMDKASEALFALQPVSFRYKKEIDPKGTSQFGLVAEDVEKVNRDLVVRDKEGKPYSVRYDAVNAMLLNEFLKEHKAFFAERRKVQEQQATVTQLRLTVAQQQNDFQATVARLTARLDEQAAQVQKVSAQLEASKPVPQVVNNP